MQDKPVYPRTVISIMVDDSSGTLARVCGMFYRRAFNIDTITTSATIEPGITRLTISVRADEKTLNQVLRQTERLEEVHQAFVLDDSSLVRELLLIKVETDAAKMAELRDIAAVYKAKIIDLSPESIVMELTGGTPKVDGFLRMMENYHVLEMCRTGLTALERGGVHEHHKKLHLEPQVPAAEETV